MLWVYDHYKYFYSYSAGIDFSRQILTFKDDTHAGRVKFKYPNLFQFFSFNPLTAKLFNLNFHPLEVVSR